MTHDPLPKNKTSETSHQWTVWTRGRPDFWEFRAMHGTAQIDKFVHVLETEHPDLEILVLPPGETPIQVPAHCDRKKTP
jgi:hypothetical protein